MRPEYRKEIDEKYRKKIEAIIRKPQRTEETEAVTRCPYCTNEVPEADLYCSQVRDNRFCTPVLYCILHHCSVISGPDHNMYCNVITSSLHL